MREGPAVRDLSAMTWTLTADQEPARPPRRGVLDQFLDPLVGLLLVTSRFVRVSPEQELRIVEALQGSGQIVILVDDNYATILLAVREGRQIFADIRKFVRSLLASLSPRTPTTDRQSADRPVG